MKRMQYTHRNISNSSSIIITEQYDDNAVIISIQ